MSKYFFVKTCYERPNASARTKKIEKKIRVRPIGGQEFNGKNLDVTMNFACSRPVRDPEVNPVGTIFGFDVTHFDEVKKNHIVTHYRVNGNKLTPVDENGNSDMDKYYQEVYPYMVNEERRLTLDFILSGDDIPLT